MAYFDVAFINARLADGFSGTLGVNSGRVAARLPQGTTFVAQETIDLGNALVLPGLVEGHIHLDTSFYGDAWKPHKPDTNGFSVRERVAFQMANLAKAAPMRERAENQLALCVGHGTTHMRSHVMVDATIGLSHVEAILAVREAWRDVIDIQLVAFPQSGILTSPGTASLLADAVSMGCDLVGGLDPATLDRDIEAHLDAVFGVAESHGVGVDIHLHDAGTLGVFEIEQICVRATALGLSGKVAVSHAYCLGQVAETELKRSADLLARSGVAIMTIAPPNGPFPPVAALRAAGVTVFSGSDNIRDSWWPYGDGDMLGRANMIGHRSAFFTDDQLLDAFDVVTEGGAKALGIHNYGLSVGDWADLVVVDALHVPQAVVGVPRSRNVFKRGKLVADNAQVERA